MFDRFPQAIAAKRKFGGSGLGFHRHNRVEMHGGTVKAESCHRKRCNLHGQPAGKGSPIAEDNCEGGDESVDGGAELKPAVWMARVLMVDDEADARDCWARCLVMLEDCDSGWFGCRSDAGGGSGESAGAPERHRDAG
jgi:hypothetical protein